MYFILWGTFVQDSPLRKRVAINVPITPSSRNRNPWMQEISGVTISIGLTNKSSRMKNLMKHYVTKWNAHFLTSRRFEAVTSDQADLLSCREPMGLFKWRLHVSKQLIPLSLPSSQYLISETASFRWFCGILRGSGVSLMKQCDWQK